MGKLEFKIKDFGSISEAKLNIGKINIIAGVNGSGKSTASKIFYSFLSSISQEGIEFLDKRISILYQNVEKTIKIKTDYSVKELIIKLKTLVDNILIDDIFENDELKNIFNELMDIEVIKESENAMNEIKELEKYLNAKNNIEKQRSLAFEDILDNEFNNSLSIIFININNLKSFSL
ncbi:MAG: hypothetical protein LBT10_01130 [Methanobrevibacter sp.]|jgi:ABC-type branched-subunit amino acid transport system ATPase component|nr:hypothetical protein [Methanobrevibacter sp.]